MTTINYTNTSFLKSVAQITELLPDIGKEIAIVGRSNAGKSSVINKLTNQKALARTSKTPGRTQLINFFVIDNKDNNIRLVDLPGYGFAKVPEGTRKQWKTLIGDYLEIRSSLCGLIIVMDIRHPLTDLDWQMLAWVQQQKLKAHVLLTKSDKLSRSLQLQTLQKVSRELAEYNLISVGTFSVPKNQGRDELVNVLNGWLN